MSVGALHGSVVDGLALPRLVQLRPNLYGAAFALMKLLPARFMLDQAELTGLLKPGGTVIETSSGTFGIGLAMICALRGYRLLLVTDPAVDAPLKRRMEQLGATVEVCTEPAVVGGYQQARLQRVAALKERHPDAFIPSQYDNPHNPDAYSAFAELLAENLGRVHCLVGTVGSGGSMCGTASYLRAVFPDLHVVGVDTHGSTLFGHKDAGKRLLRGLGNSLMPKNVTHAIFDEVHWVSGAEGFSATRALHREHALYMGPTSGTAYLVAEWYAKRHPKECVVVVMPDEGNRYQDTVYDDQWLRAQNALLEQPPRDPSWVDYPLDAGPCWSAMHWGRRTLDEVMSSQSAARHAHG